MLLPRPGSRSRLVPLPISSLVVPAVAGLGGLAFLAWRPGVARSMAGSPRAVAFSMVVAVLVLGLGWALPRLGRGPVVTALAQAVPVGIAFVVAVLPAFRSETVVEAFPSSDAATRSAESAPAGDEPAVVVGSGRLAGIDHDATGTVLLLGRDDGSYVVRLQDIDIEPGPDYHVHLVPGAGSEDPDGGVRLDTLRGNKGSQNYAVPVDVSLRGPVTVLVWCRAFAVPIAAATLRPSLP